ncbi:MAG TPA: hypothetical protein VFF14_09905 [Candidatus Deferrimicrobium sp.]|nr:hypothetical protein [Candidatus Deferrimicrobium sp.]
MKLQYLRTDFPGNTRSHILIKNMAYPNPELVHFVLVLSNKGTLWVDVFWPYDLEAEQYTRHISEPQFWETFRKWRLDGMKLGDSEKVANALARKQLEHKMVATEEKKI